jgi:hypothetical protein
MKFAGIPVFAVAGLGGLVAVASPAAANINYGSQEPTWSWSFWSNYSPFQSRAANVPTLGANSEGDFALKTGKIDDRARQSQTKRIRRSVRDGQSSRMPFTHQQLMSFHGSVSDLSPGVDRPIGASPGVFINYVPDAAGLGDSGGGTTVPLPPAFVLAAVGLGLVGVARRLGWGGKPDAVE